MTQGYSAQRLLNSMKTTKEHVDNLHNQFESKKNADGTSSWDQTKAHKQSLRTKLVILLIIYVFSQDDQKISYAEKREIHHFLRKEKGYFSEEYAQEMEQLLSNYPTMDYVVTYLLDKNVNVDLLHQLLDITRKNIPQKPQYEILLRKLEQQFVSQISQ